MSADWPAVGDSCEPFEMTVDRAAVVRFARALGADPAPYLERGIAPPTFPTVFRMLAEIPSVERIDPAQLLHGEEEYTYERPLRIGERITCTARVDDVYEREGRSGRLRFVVIGMEGRNERRTRVFTGRTVGVVR